MNEGFVTGRCDVDLTCSATVCERNDAPMVTCNSTPRAVGGLEGRAKHEKERQPGRAANSRGLF
eukprot:1181925-Prorocentrum_minimum.AAC.6